VECLLQNLSSPSNKRGHLENPRRLFTELLHAGGIDFMIQDSLAFNGEKRYSAWKTEPVQFCDYIAFCRANRVSIVIVKPRFYLCTYQSEIKSELSACASTDLVDTVPRANPQDDFCN
jgi:hypothetical protein